MINVLKKSKMALFIFSVLCFGCIYVFWPQNEQLPVLGKVNNFQLEEMNGAIYESDNAKVKLVTFFYTNCPDFCPLTMADFKELQQELKNRQLFGEKVELVAISFDPERDTPGVLKTYANSFDADDSGWKWLRGSQEKTNRLAQELRVQYTKIDEVFYSHSTTMFLLDQNNEVRALYDMAYRNKPIDKEKIIADIDYLASRK